jgi:hypothetical protein
MTGVPVTTKHEKSWAATVHFQTLTALFKGGVSVSFRTGPETYVKAIFNSQKSGVSVLTRIPVCFR